MVPAERLGRGLRSQLGELCSLGGEACCNGPTVVCDPSPGLEFPTCIVAR